MSANLQATGCINTSNQLSSLNSGVHQTLGYFTQQIWDTTTNTTTQIPESGWYTMPYNGIPAVPAGWYPYVIPSGEADEYARRLREELEAAFARQREQERQRIERLAEIAESQRKAKEEARRAEREAEEKAEALRKITSEGGRVFDF